MGEADLADKGQSNSQVGALRKKALEENCEVVVVSAQVRMSENSYMSWDFVSTLIQKKLFQCDLPSACFDHATSWSSVTRSTDWATKAVPNVDFLKFIYPCNF